MDTCFRATRPFLFLNRFFSYPAAVTATVTGDRAANLDLCLALMAFSSEGPFPCQHLLRHGTSVYTVSSEGPAPTSHSGIRTGDARIIRSLRLRSDHCARRAAEKYLINSKWYISGKHLIYSKWLGPPARSFRHINGIRGNIARDTEFQLSDWKYTFSGDTPSKLLNCGLFFVCNCIVM
jgi:hypothetical protein